MHKYLIVLLLCVLFPVTTQATTRKVYTGGAGSGSGPTYSLSRLQSAIDDAAQTDPCGSEILIEQNASFSAPDDGYVLRKLIAATPAWDCITIRTGVDSSGNLLASNLFPAAGIRMTTSYRSVLASFVPTYNNSPIFRTVYPGETGMGCTVAPCVGSGWTLKWLEFGPKVDWAQRALVRLGSNNAGRAWNGSCGTWPDPTPSCWDTELPNGDTPDRLIELPQYLTFIQNDIHGDPFVGQHQGLFLATKDVRVLHNSFTDFKSMIETQALYSLNGIGPFDVENNLFEATGENTMWGGGDPYLILRATISGSPTTTSITLSSPVWWSRIDTTTQTANLSTDMFSGQFISVTHAGQTYVGMTCALSGSTCTLSPALPVTPSAGDIVQWSWVHGGVTFKNNLLRKQVSWLQNALTTPTLNTPTAGTGGSLSAGSHCYKLMWFAFVSGNDVGEDIQSAPSSEQCVTTAASGKVTLTWSGDAHATRYWIYGNGVTSTEDKYWEIAAGTTTFVDTGTAGTAGTPLPNGHQWTIKNTHEWKNCEGAGPMGPCLVEGNVIEYNRCCLQSNTVSIKVNNQEGYDVSATVRNFTFRNNWIRHGNRGIAISTSNADTYGGGTMRNVTITNNLFTDMASTYRWPLTEDGNNTPIYIGAGAYTNHVGNRGCVDCTFTHNSFFVNTNDMKGPLWFGMNSSTDTHTNFILRNNIMPRECTASYCAGDTVVSLKTLNPGSNTQGTPSWNAAVSGSSFADHNAWPDGNSGVYTAGPFTNPFFPTDAALKSTHLANYTNCNTDVDILGCALVTGSSMHNTASDSTDVGANVTTIKSFTDNALNGAGGGGGGAILITTTTLTSAVTRNSYSATITVTGGTSPYTCTKLSGTLPTGITLNSACTLTGTPTTVGTYSFTVRATDAVAATDDQALTLRTRSRRPAASIGTNERYIFSGVEPSPANDRDVLAGDLWRDSAANVLKWCKTAASWSCTLWETLGTGAGGGALDDLSDVALSSPTTNQFLRYSSGVWQNISFNGFVQGGNAFGATAIFGTTDAQAINIVAEGTVRLKTDASPSVKAVTLQANGDANPELYVTQGDASDWMSLGFATGDGRRIVAHTSGGANRSYQGLAGATTSTDYIFGIGSSANSGGTNTRWVGVRMDGLFSVKHLSLETGTRPTCAVGERGTFWYVAGGAGVKDTVEVCAKDASNVYAWRVIY